MLFVDDSAELSGGGVDESEDDHAQPTSADEAFIAPEDEYFNCHKKAKKRKRIAAGSDSDAPAQQQPPRKKKKKKKKKKNKKPRRIIVDDDDDDDDEIQPAAAGKKPSKIFDYPHWGEVQNSIFNEKALAAFKPQPGDRVRADEKEEKKGCASFESTFMVAEVDLELLTSLSDAELHRFKDELHQKITSTLSDPDPVSSFKSFYHLENMAVEHVLPEQVNGPMTAKYLHAVMLLVRLLSMRGLMGNKDQTTQMNRAVMTHILRCMSVGKHIIVNHVKQTKLKTMDLMTHLDEDLHLFEYSLPDPSKQTAWQRLILFILGKLFENGYRRYNGECYQEIRIALIQDIDGNESFLDNNKLVRMTDTVLDEFEIKAVHNTHAWHRICSLEECVMKMVDKDVDYDMWLDLTSGSGNAKSTAGYLEVCFDHEFPPLQPDRRSRAFQNGVLTLHPPDETFYSFGEGADISNSLVCCKYFPQQFDKDFFSYNNWYNISTPAFQSIIDYQLFSPLIASVIYAQLGRLLYEVNEHDGWQVIFFIKGVAQSGKSTIGKLVQQFFQREDIAIMSSNIEQKFGLDAIVDKKLFICFEVTKNWGLARSDFQSLISGEELSVAGKFKTARTVTWKTPGVLFGNELGPWIDSAGSIVRRLLVCEFNRRVKESDPDLDNKLKSELPAILFKSQQGYMALVKEFAGHGIWEKIPRYFKNMQTKIAVSTNPIKQFLHESDILIRGDDFKMPMFQFQAHLSEFLQTRKIHVQFSFDQVIDVFEQEGMNVETTTAEWGGKPVRGRFVCGVTLKDKVSVEDVKEQEGPQNPEEERKRQYEEETAEFKSKLPVEPIHLMVHLVAATIEDCAQNLYQDAPEMHFVNVQPMEIIPPDNLPPAADAVDLQPPAPPPPAAPVVVAIAVDVNLEFARQQDVGFRISDIL
jgi:hypothetical protein